MVDAFEELSFLTRSENRVEVLEELTDGPVRERTLVDRTGISDVTVGRILDDFTDRGWAAETDVGYETSPLGDLLAEDYRRLYGTMDVAARLGPVADLLPLAEMEFDLRLLASARVTDPDEFNAMRTVDRWVELIRGADHIRVVSPPANATKVVSETVVEEVKGRMRFEAVISADYFEPPHGRRDIRDTHREMVEAGAELYQLPPGPTISANVALYDDLATMAGSDDDGTMRVGIESRADPVRDWVRERFETYRDRADRLRLDDI